MLRLIDYLAKLIFDVLSVPLLAISYFITGTLLVGVPIYLIVILFEWIGSQFY